MLSVLLTHHWNGNVVILVKFQSPAAPKVVISKTSDAASQWLRFHLNNNDICVPSMDTTRAIDIFFVVNLNELFNKQLNNPWFETPWRSCEVTVMLQSLNNPCSSEAVRLATCWFLSYWRVCCSDRWHSLCGTHISFMASEIQSYTDIIWYIRCILVAHLVFSCYAN